MRFWSGLAESASVVLAFLGFGLGWAAAAAQAAGAAASYPRAPVALEAQSPASLWLVDGFNVLHAGILHGRDRAEWWTAPRRRELLARIERFDDPGAEIWVVFDGPREPAGEGPDAGAANARVRPVFAACADDWLLARVRREPDPSRVAVVTADRAVAGRARHRGARVVSPRTFLDRCRP